MPAATLDLLIEQGATFHLTFVYGRSTGEIDNAGHPVVDPYDLTGCEARLQIRRRRGGEVLISATTTNGGIVLPDPTAGRIEVTITDEATDSLSVRRARYDLEVSYPNGEVARVLQGSVEISANITQDADLDNISTGLGDQHAIDEQDVSVDTLINDQPGTAF